MPCVPLQYLFNDCPGLYSDGYIRQIIIKSLVIKETNGYNSKTQSAINKMKQQSPNAHGIIISSKENGAVNATAIKFK